jgi:hypothetical protein
MRRHLAGQCGVGMKHFRGVSSFWNESGFLISILMGGGYFARRAMFGLFPAAVIALAVIAAGVLAFFLAKAGTTQSPDDYSDRPRYGLIDRLIFYSVLFLTGICITTTLGAAL